MVDKTQFPFSGSRGHSNRDWWPDALDVSVLHRNSSLSDPMDEGFDYAKEFKTLDLDAVIKDLRALMTDSQDWWPADFGHYGGLMIRPARPAARTHRITDRPGAAPPPAPPAPPASPPAAAAGAPGSSASRRSTAGRTTRTSTRRGASCGRSSRS